MNLQEIKKAVSEGTTVHWSNESYKVVKDNKGQWLIKCVNGSCIGLTHVDEVTLNGKEEDFYLSKTAQQRQFEQVTDKLRSCLSEMEEIIKLMPRKGNTPATCQRIAISNYLGGIDSLVNGIELEDFTPNEYSGDFKLSYS